MAATTIPEDRRNLPLDAGFDGYGRASTDTEGCARFSSVKPGRVPWPQGGMQARAHQHLDLRPRPAQPRRDAALFRRRSGQCRGSRAEDARSGAAPDLARQAGRQGRVAPADPSRRPEGDRLLRLLNNNDRGNAMTYDIVIRGGRIVDGTGSDRLHRRRRASATARSRRSARSRRRAGARSTPTASPSRRASSTSTPISTRRSAGIRTARRSAGTASPPR